MEKKEAHGGEKSAQMCTPVSSARRECTKELSITNSESKFILGLGHILLDISAKVDDNFIERYDVLIGSGILAKEIHTKMFEEMQESPLVEYIPGSAMLNSIRTAQWVLGGRSVKGRTGALGAIGNDQNGWRLEMLCEQEGVTTSFMTIETARTGVCAVCLKGVERGLIARLDAANEYELEHVKANAMLFDTAGIIYTTGYFLGCSEGELSIYAAERAKQTGALFCINLAACYVPKAYPDKLAKLITLSDYVFGNDKEAAAYGDSVGLLDTSATSVALHLANLPSEKCMRTVVITQGTACTILARSDGTFLKVPIVPVPQERIVDLNAAGDSFVGGFLAALSIGANV